MSMTTLVGLSFGVFPCLLFGFIMLLSLLICEYIEEYVAKHLCAWKNSRRRRGLRSFYRDFRDRRQTAEAQLGPGLPNPSHHRPQHHQQPSTSSTSAAAYITARFRTDSFRYSARDGDSEDLSRLIPTATTSSSSVEDPLSASAAFPPTAPPPPLPSTSSSSCYQRGAHQQPRNTPSYASFAYPSTSFLPNDPPPSYEECVLPRLRLLQNSLNSSSSGCHSNTSTGSSVSVSSMSGGGSIDDNRSVGGETGSPSTPSKTKSSSSSTTAATAAAPAPTPTYPTLPSTSPSSAPPPPSKSEKDKV